MRKAYAEAVVSLAQRDSSVIFISSDCGADERKWFREYAPNRLVETGIAEANAISIAAGLASDGYRPFILNFGYLMGRAYNQLSQSIAEDAYPVSISGYYCGVWGFGGRSHNCVTDLAIMRALPNFSVFAPADYWETKTLLQKSYELQSPSYIRLSGIRTPTVYTDVPEFSPVRRLVEGSDCTIFCHGTMVHEALTARTSHRLNCSVVDVAQLKPLPVDEIVSEARLTGRVVIAEEHSLIGGLADAIGSALGQNYPVPIRNVCVPDMFPISVRTDETNVYGKYGISSDNIALAVSDLSEKA